MKIQSAFWAIVSMQMKLGERGSGSGCHMSMLQFLYLLKAAVVMSLFRYIYIVRTPRPPSDKAKHTKNTVRPERGVW